MIDFSSFKDKTISVVGLGKYKHGTGVSSALFFAKNGAKKVIVADEKSENEFLHQIKRLKRFKNIEFIFGRFDEKKILSSDLILKNPAIPINHSLIKKAKQKKIPVVNDWSVFLSLVDNILIGVTGSRGKSTTTHLIFNILKTEIDAFLCGNTGESPLSKIDNLKKETVVVAELSSWLLNGFSVVKKSPKLSVFTNFYKEHLDKYPSLKSYLKDKENIFKFQSEDDFLVLNYDDKTLREVSKKAKSKIFWFSKKALPKRIDGAYLSDDGWIIVKINDTLKKIVKRGYSSLLGEHNTYNLLAAVLVAYLFGIQNKNIKKAIKNFKGVPFRLELIGKVKGVYFYNDTTATSPEATMSSLNALAKRYGKEKIFLIVGGQDKKLDYKKLANQIKKQTKGVVLLAGSATEKIKNEFNKIGFSNIIKEVDNMKGAVLAAFCKAKKGDVILLSPAAASFGLFKNEFDRGEQFNKVFLKIKK